jgi:hypothetical protein
MNSHSSETFMHFLTYLLPIVTVLIAIVMLAFTA